MSRESTKRRFRPGRAARSSAAYPEVHAGRRAFLHQLGWLTAGALAAPVLVRCVDSYEGTPPMLDGWFRIEPLDPTLPVGLSRQFNATYGPDQQVSSEAHWASSDPGVASIDQQGLVVTVSAGSTLISAEYGSGHEGSKTFGVKTARDVESGLYRCGRRRQQLSGDGWLSAGRSRPRNSS